MITCPNCNSALDLVQLTEDADARKLFGLVAHRPDCAALLAYLQLFKPSKQALRWSRSLKLAQQVLEQWGDDGRLGVALMQTVEGMRERRQQAGWSPLTNHNYLDKVIKSLPVMTRVTTTSPAIAKPRRTRDITLEEQLMDTSWANDD